MKNNNFLKTLKINENLPNLFEEISLIVDYICHVNKIDKNKLIKKKLENIDLICIDTKQPYEALKSIIICDHFFEFGSKKFLTNVYIPECEDYGIEQIYIQEINYKQYSEICFSLSECTTNEFVLIVQHDSFIINPNLWTDLFLNYDYIGAPWSSYITKSFNVNYGKFNHNNCVGNGGFSLRSKKFLQFSETIERDAYKSNNEDAILCHSNYYKALEQGIKFAPKTLASVFSYESDETLTKYPETGNFHFENSFGFHHREIKNKIIDLAKNCIMNKQQNNLEVGKFIENKKANQGFIFSEEIDINKLNKTLIEKNDFKDFFDYLEIHPTVKITQEYLEEQKQDTEIYFAKKQKQNLEKLDIVIIVRIDSVQRLKNLQKVTSFLNSFFENTLHIVEYDYETKIFFEGNYNKYLVKPVNSKFNKNYVSNLIYKELKNPIIMNLDSDVILNPNSIVDSYYQILSNKESFCMPHNGISYFLNEKNSSLCIEKNILPEIWKEYYGFEQFTEGYYVDGKYYVIDINMIMKKHPGYAYMFDKSKFKELGMENEKIEKHGHDDFERVVRIYKSGYNIYYSEGNAYHLHHFRDPKNNTWYQTDTSNLDEIIKILNMNTESFSEYIKSWEWND